MKRLSAIVLMLVLVLPLLSPATASAAQPDRSYIYDYYFNAVPAVSSYEVKEVLDATNLGSAFKNAQDIFVDGEDQLYILDSDNGRVFWVDEQLQPVKIIDTFTYNGEPYTLTKGAQGIFFQDAKKELYIADTEADAIVVCDRDGVISRIYGKPESDLLDETIAYKPKKIIVDNLGIMYVLSSTVNTGALMLDQNNAMLGFYGTNEVRETAEIRMEFFWRSIMTQEQIDQSEYSFQPTQLQNLFWANDRFIYATSPSVSNIKSPVTKLNGMGKNVISTQGVNAEYYWGDVSTNIEAMEGRSSNVTGDSKISVLFADITVDDEGVFTIVDTVSGKCYQYDDSSNLLCVFGGIGYQRGLFTTPTAIECNSNSDIYVLDSKQNTVTVFEQTYYGEKIREALALYNDGLYAQALEPWFEVLRMNANYYIAYIGIGEAYLAMKEYDLAKHYFKLADDFAGYSEAKAGARGEFLRGNFAVLVVAVAALMLLVLFYDGIKKQTKRAVAAVKQRGRRKT